MRGRIEQWRLTRTRQGQMPEELWLETAEAQALDRLEADGKARGASRKERPEDPPRMANVQAVMAAATTALRERGESQPRFYPLPDALASYADGRRSVADIREAAHAEYGYAFSVEALMDLFGLLEQGGIMTRAR